MRLPLFAILSFALEMTKIHLTFTVLFVLSLFYSSPASSRTLEQFPKTTVLNVSALFAMTTQILSVNQNTFETQDQEKLQQQSDSSMTLKLYSRDILSLTSFNNYEDRTLARLKRDTARVNFISKKLNKGGFSPVDVKTRLVPASAEYIARFEIGTPPRPVYVVIDTGSEITWLQCSPCTSCYNQTNPIFDPIKSSSYKPLSCDSRQCKDLDHSSCSHSKCYYHLTYGDGSTSVGDFATEKFAFGGTISEHVAMGCGHENKVSFVQADGLLGLGDGPLSFLSQINQKSFSYCLVYRDSGSDSTLSFGSSIDRDAVTTSLLGDMKPFYASTLTAICVGRILFNITYKGHHGVTAIVDTGTSVTRFPSFIYKPVELMHLLPQLRDPQSELLLLRSCMGIAKLFFGLRTCQPEHVKEAAACFDRGLRSAIEDIVVCGGQFFGDLQWRLASLPIRAGGLGLYSAVEASSYAFVASRAQSWLLQDHILRDSGVRGMDTDFEAAIDRLRGLIPSFDLDSFTNKDTVPPKAQHALASALFSKVVQDMEAQFDLTVRQKAVFGCLQAEHAQDFLMAIPIDGLGQHMSPVEYRSILRYRLMIPLYPVDEPCPVCHKVCLDSFGDHAVHCRELQGFKYRHDLVRDILFDALRRAGVSAKKEAPVNFLSDPQDGRSTLRPADVLVYGWVGGRHACVDLTGVSPLVGLGSGDFTVGQAALKAASAKVSKHEKACIDNQHVFIPFSFDTFGFLAPDAVQFLKRVQRVMHSNVMSPRSMDVVFKRIGFAIQKGLAAQLVARLPSISM